MLEELQEAKLELLNCQEKLTKVAKKYTLESIGSVTLEEKMDENGLATLISKLEHKNIELETDLEKALKTKQEADFQIFDLKKKLENKEEQSVCFMNGDVNDNKLADIESKLEAEQEKYSEAEKQLSDLRQQLLNQEKHAKDKLEKLNKELDELKKVKENQKTPEHPLESSSDLRQEKNYLETRVDVLSSEVKSKQTQYLEARKQLREKESELSEMKLELRSSLRKQQQAEDVSSVLRDSNKSLREKLYISEKSLYEKSKIEEELKDELKKLNQEIASSQKEVLENENLYQISKERNHHFSKSQGQYEELVQQNAHLKKEYEDKCEQVARLSEEAKRTKSDLISKQNECSRLEKFNVMLKTQCKEMDSQLRDFEAFIETQELTLVDYKKENCTFKREIHRVEEELKQLNSCLSQEKKAKAELEEHLEDLSCELESQQQLQDTELRGLEEQASHFKAVAAHLEDQVAQQNEALTQKVADLEGQLLDIKEEAARHLTQISSLKASNLKLTQALDKAIDNQREAQRSIDQLCNNLESNQTNHTHEKVKLQETVAQQTKLIDFLQQKAEDMERRKRPPLSRLFGKKESQNSLPMPFKEVENLLEKEKGRCRRLQDLLSQSRAENMSLQREMDNVRRPRTLTPEIPNSPMSRAMHTAITSSPTTKMESPLHDSKIVKPQGMKHKIPHRFSEMLCMRSAKCCACLDSVHFGRPAVKCQECGILCHPKCATSLPNTCGLPSAFMQHFKLVVRERPSVSLDLHKEISEGWVKVPKRNKQGWDRRYLRVLDDVLYVSETSDEGALLQLSFREAKILVTSAVSAAELPFAATSDLPYVLKVECLPHTTCWPQRCLYIMAPDFNYKQMWVATLEALADRHSTEVVPKIKLMAHPVLKLKGDHAMDVLSTLILENEILLLGAIEGLFVFDMRDKYEYALKRKLEGIDSVYQMAVLKNLGYIVMIEGLNRNLTLFELEGVRTGSLNFRSVSDVLGCHLFSAQEPFLCTATSETVALYQWQGDTFTVLKVIDTCEPCSCIHFASNRAVFGADRFYVLNIDSLTVKEFLNSSDASLAGLVYEVSQFHSFPVAILQVAPPNQPEEYLVCFHELGVFVDHNGQRTRSEDMKWSRLPLSFAYSLPYLFVTHFNSVEVVEIPSQGTAIKGVQSVMPVANPQYIGVSPEEGAVYISSNHDQLTEILLVDGKSIGTNLNFSNHSSSPQSCSSKGSESESLDFSFSTSINQSLDERSAERLSVESESSQS